MNVPAGYESLCAYITPWSRSKPNLSETSESSLTILLFFRSTNPPANTGSSSNTIAAAAQHPFYTLPSELILDIVDYLPADAFINFAFANYPLLNSYGLAPALSQPRIRYITTQTHIPALFPLLRMPAEIMYVLRIPLLFLLTSIPGFTSCDISGLLTSCDSWWPIIRI